MVSKSATTPAARLNGSSNTAHHPPQPLHNDISGPVDGRPVVLLHGWGSSAELMSPIAEALNDTYLVLNIDLPGHGRSPAPATGIGVPEQAELVFDVVRHQTDRPVTIVGHSNGGRIALYMASEPRYAAHIDRLILISPSGIRRKRTVGYYVRRTVASALKTPFNLLPPRFRAFGLDWLRHSLLWKALGSSDYRKLEGTMRDTFVKTVNHYLDDDISRITAPTLLFWGDQDTAVTLHQMQLLERGIPNAGLVILKGAGHYGYLDDPATVVAGSRHFLENA